MTTRRSATRILLIGALLGVVALGAWRIYPGQPPAQPRGAEVTALNGLAEQNRARLERLRAELHDRRRAAGAHGDDATPAAPDRAALVTELRDEIQILASARTMFNRDELIRAELARLARDPKHVALAVDLATDWQLASKLFGDQQAESRVYALQLLRHLAEAGDLRSVATAVDRIGTTLNTEDPWIKGVEYDYVDALSVYLRSVGTDKFLADQASYYDQMHLTERTSLEVQKAVHDSGILKEASAATLQQVRDEFWHYLGKEPPRG